MLVTVMEGLATMMMAMALAMAMLMMMMMMMLMAMMTMMMQVLGGDVMSSLWKHVHLSRLVRLSWLWKFGGLYLDTDLVVLGDLLGPWHNTSYIGLHNLHPEIGLSNAAIKLDRWAGLGLGPGLSNDTNDDRHHPVLIEWLGLMMEEYDPSSRNSWNDVITTEVILEYCAVELEEAGGREVGRK